MSDKLPLVSIIIPVHNQELYIGYAIGSILNQKYKNFEIIIIDDGSTDNSINIIRSFKDTRIKYYFQTNKGQIVARNKGLEYSKGDYISFLDADDLILPNKLLTQVDFLENKKNIDIVIGGCFIIDKDGKYISGGKPYPGYLSIEELLLSNRFTIHSTLIRKKCLKDKIRFDNNLTAAEDWDFYLQLFLSDCKMFQIDEIVCAYRQLDFSISKNIEKVCSNKIKIINKFFSKNIVKEKYLNLKSLALSDTLLSAAYESFQVKKIIDGRKYLKESTELNKKLLENNSLELFEKFIIYLKNYNKGNVEELIEIFSKSIENIIDKNTIYNYICAKFYFNISNFKIANNFFDKLIINIDFSNPKIKEYNKNLLISYAVSLYREKKYSKSEIFYKLYYKYYKTTYKYYNGLANIYVNTGNLERALKLYSESLLFKDLNEREEFYSLSGKGVALLKLKKFSKAIEIFKIALSKEKITEDENFFIFLNLIECYIEIDDYKSSIDFIAKYNNNNYDLQIKVNDLLLYIKKKNKEIILNKIKRYMKNL